MTLVNQRIDVCPPEAALIAFLESATAIDADTVAEHVENCPRCCARLEELSNVPWIEPAVLTTQRMSHRENLDSSLERILAQGPMTLAAKVPTQIGAYRILEPLGQGGMAIVYRALQTALNRVVALKMIRSPETAGPIQTTRFQAEIDALAKLPHPGIVRVYDAGIHEGAPYLVMELMNGGSLADRIDKRPQPPRAAAHALAEIARTLAHAHRLGIIHRDLKPENILIDETPNAVPNPDRLIAGNLKIADFGLAKLVGGAGPTTDWEILGTPGYMAPEQASGRLSAIGPWTDIYALGATLYALLTGRQPLLGDSPWETLRLIVEQEPVAPRLIRPQIPRDLEVICLKCLAKEPTHRYATADELADDLERFLNRKPILARPLGPVARLGKRVRRNPIIASLLFLLGGCIVASIVLLSIQVARTEPARRDEAQARIEAEEQRDFAQAQRKRAQQSADEQALVVRFLLEDFFQAARFRAVGDWPGKQALMAYLDQAAGKIPARFGANPLLAARLEIAVGVNFRHWGDYAKAEKHLLAASAYQQMVADVPADEREDLLNSLAVLYDVTGRSAQAEAMHREIYSSRDARFGSDHPGTLTTRHNLAAALKSLGRTDEALEHLEQVLEARRRILPNPHPHTLRTILELTELLLPTDRRRAEELIREAIEGGTHFADEEPTILANALGLQVRLLLADESFAEAESPAQKCLEIRRRVLGPNHPDTLAALSDSARIDFALDRRQEAEEKLQTARKGCREAFGERHPETLRMDFNFGMFQWMSGKQDDAERTLAEVLRKREEVLGKDHSTTRFTRSELLLLQAEISKRPESK